MSDTPKAPSVVESFVPLAALLCLLSLSVYLFDDSALSGGSQIALVFATIVAALIGVKNGYSWRAIVSSVENGITMGLAPIVILLSIGSLIGIWMLAGTVPAMIYYGLEILSPSWFYLSACIISALVSLCLGSSWTTAGTIGVGLMGVSFTMGLSPAISAGAVVSGAYFGDKLSPLSDTTNLAPSVAGSELFDHIRHLLWTTVPSFLIAIVFFGFLQGSGEPATSSDLAAVRETLDSQFDIQWYLLLPLPVLLVLVFRGIPALVAIWGGVLAGVVIAVTFQAVNAQVVAMGIAGTPIEALQLIKGVWITMVDGYPSRSGVVVVDELLSKGGMSSMLNTVWLIVCAMAFGGVMEETGVMSRLVGLLLAVSRSARYLVTSAVCSAFATNLVTSDQYISIVLPGRMFRPAFEAQNLAPVNLSRALEDGGTVTSPLIPWNTCGAYMAATLGVATTSYLPFAIFCLVNPLIAIMYAQFEFKQPRTGQASIAQ